MNVLMGKYSRTGGHLYINEREVEMYKYKKIIGYVPQDDVMLDELTVRENIAYAARVRLPHWTGEQTNQYIDSVLDALDLSHVANNLCGTEISGGQRKRVNIGMELVTVPSALFLDEPTSGLDATAALKISRTLQRISGIGLTIVAVIHQPRLEIFETFDDVLMIAPGGQTAYLGPRRKIIPYFQALGFAFLPDVNPADTLMDILSGKGVRQQPYVVNELVQLWAQRDSHRGGSRNSFQDGYNEDSEDSDGTNSDILMKSISLPRLSAASEKSYMTAGSEVIQERRSSNDEYFMGDAVTRQVFGDDEGKADSEGDVASLLSVDSHQTKSLPVFQPKELAIDISNDFSKSTINVSTDEGSQRRYDSLRTHKRIRRITKSRGASFLQQLLLAHNRSLLQQFRRFNAFVLEVAVASLCGLLMGLAVMSYNGGAISRSFSSAVYNAKRHSNRIGGANLMLFCWCSHRIGWSACGCQNFQRRATYLLAGDCCWAQFSGLLLGQAHC